MRARVRTRGTAHDDDGDGTSLGLAVLRLPSDSVLNPPALLLLPPTVTSLPCLLLRIPPTSARGSCQAQCPPRDRLLMRNFY